MVQFDSQQFEWVCKPIDCTVSRGKSQRFNTKCRRCVQCEDARCDKFYINAYPNQTKECLSKPAPQHHRDCGAHGYNCNCFKCKCAEGWTSKHYHSKECTLKSSSQQKKTPGASSGGQTGDGSGKAPSLKLDQPMLIVVGIVATVTIILLVACILICKKLKKPEDTREDSVTRKIVAQLKEHLDVELQLRRTTSGAQVVNDRQYIEHEDNRAQMDRGDHEEEHGDLYEVEVVRDYEAQLDDELTLRVGDRIQVTTRDHTSMYGSGYLNGNEHEHGMFPLSHVVDLPEAPGIEQPAISPGHAPLQIVGHARPDVVQVTHDYTAQKDDELTLRVGDTIQVVARDPVSMYGEGYLNGNGEEYGIFPLNYVSDPESFGDAHNSNVHLDDLPEPRGDASHEADAGIGEEEWVEVTHDYTAQKDDELTLRVGDTIKVTAKDPLTTFGTGFLDEKHGIFPLSYVKPKR